MIEPKMIIDDLSLSQMRNLLSNHQIVHDFGTEKI